MKIPIFGLIFFVIAKSTHWIWLSWVVTSHILTKKSRMMSKSGKRSQLNRVPAVSYLRAKVILVLSNYACAASSLPTG